MLFPLPSWQFIPRHASFFQHKQHVTVMSNKPISKLGKGLSASSLCRINFSDVLRTFWCCSLSLQFLLNGHLLVPDACLLPTTIALKLNNQTKLQYPDIMACLLFCPFVTQPLRVQFTGAFMGRAFCLANRRRCGFGTAQMICYGYSLTRHHMIWYNIIWQ